MGKSGKSFTNEDYEFERTKYKVLYRIEGTITYDSNRFPSFPSVVENVMDDNFDDWYREADTPKRMGVLCEFTHRRRELEDDYRKKDGSKAGQAGILYNDENGLDEDERERLSAKYQIFSMYIHCYKKRVEESSDAVADSSDDSDEEEDNNDNAGDGDEGVYDDEDELDSSDDSDEDED